MRNICAFLILAVLGIVGCSGGGGNPIAPESNIPNERAASPGSLDSVPVIDGTVNSDGSFQATGVLGAYELNIDPAKMTGELVSKRLPTALGASWTVSGIGFFTVAPCSSCLTLESIGLTADNYLQLNFHILHPFKPGVTSLPPSGVNRLDLDIFDLAMVVIPVGAISTNYGLTGANIYSGILTQNAGYTTELADIVGDRAAMPYALVVDDNTGGGSTWNEFPMGADSFFDVFLDLNTLTTFTFDLFLTMGYGQSAQGKTQRLTPTYFNPEFNKKQAWKVIVTPPEGSSPPAMGNTWQHNDSTTPFIVKVEVCDWQHGVTAIANPPVNTGDIAEASDVTMVSVEIPGMTNTLPQVSTPTSGTGSPVDPLLFEVLIANENLLGVGEYVGLVKVMDSRVPTTAPPGDGIDFMIDSPNGIALNNYGITEYAAYQTFVATVVLGCGPITGSIVSPSCPLTGVAHTGTVDFSVTAASGNGGDPIVLYECDYEYDGSNFTTDFSNTTGIFDDVGPFLNPNCPTPTPVYYTVAFRATDSCSPPNVTVFATCDVTVDTCCGPLTGPGQIVSPTCPANVRNGGQLTFEVGGYTCPGGSITYYIDYDWDGVPANFTEDASSTTGTFAPRTYVNTGASDITYTTGFKAKDNCTPPNEEIFTTTCTVTVHADASPVGNITLVVNRMPLANNYQIDSSTPWTISWAAATNAHEYAVYYDNNPADGLTNNLTYVGVSTTTSYDVPSSHLPSNHYVVGNTYVVRSRSTIGDDLSETTNSEPAFVTVNGWETMGTSQNNGEGWIRNNEIGGSTYYQYPYTGTSYCAHGSRSMQYTPFCGANYMTYAGRWNGDSKQTPTVPNSTVRQLDFSLYIYQTYSPQGFVVGTCPYQPTNAWALTSDMEWASATTGGSYWAYNTNSSDVVARISDVPTTTNNAWIWSSSSDRRKLCGSNVNIDGDSSDQYVVIEYFKLNTYSTQPYPRTDELSIAIY